MVGDFPYDLIIIAIVGGFTLNFFNLWEDYKKPKGLRVEKEPVYWIFLLVWPLIGAFLTYLSIRMKYNVDPMIAFIIGLTAPTTIQALLAKGISPQIHTSNPESR